MKIQQHILCILYNTSPDDSDRKKMIKEEADRAFRKCDFNSCCFTKNNIEPKFIVMCTE